jgi:hypothetical protein
MPATIARLQRQHNGEADHAWVAFTEDHRLSQRACRSGKSGLQRLPFDASAQPAYIVPMNEPNSERIVTPMPKSLVDAIDDYRYSARIPSRAEAIRQLLEAALKAPRQRKNAA